METNEQLDILLKKKAEIASQTGLDSEERKKLLRRIRREIRQIRGPSADSSEEGEEGAEPRPRRSRRSKDENPVLRDYRKDLEGFKAFKLSAIQYYLDQGLIQKDLKSVPHDQTMAMFSFIQMFEFMVEPSQALEKFRTRWADHDPEWFTIIGTDLFEEVAFGPLPSAMTTAN